MSGSVALVLGRPPGPRSVLHEVQDQLREAGVRVTVTVVPDGAPLRPAEAQGVRTADLRVLKDLAAGPLQTLARLDLPCCNEPGATARSLDKPAVGRRLREAGVPVPGEVEVDHWAEVRRAAAAAPVVVKPRSGSRGEGVLLLDGPAPATPPATGPWLVQERVRGDGLDRKAYVVGDAVEVVLRTWPPPPDRGSRPAGDDAADPAVRAVALRAAGALGLEVCGVDVLVTAEGPVVVDVNAWPGFKGVPGAARRLSAHLLDRVGEREVLSCASSS